MLGVRERGRAARPVLQPHQAEGARVRRRSRVRDMQRHSVLRGELGVRPGRPDGHRAGVGGRGEDRQGRREGKGVRPRQLLHRDRGELRGGGGQAAGRSRLHERIRLRVLVLP